MIKLYDGFTLNVRLHQLLGRPKGSKNKKGRVLDEYEDQIKDYLKMGLTISEIRKIINNQLDTPISYQAFKYHIDNNDELREAKLKK